MADCGRRAKVGAECRLAVGSCRDEVEPSPGVEDAGEEAGCGVETVVLERHRRHRDQDVVGEQLDQRPEIGGLPCADELRHDRVLGRRVPTAQVGRRPARSTPSLTGGWPAAGRTPHAEAPIRGDPVQPRANRRPAPRSRRSRPTQPAASPAGRPRRPGTTRASDSNARASRGGSPRSARGTPRRRQPAPGPAHWFPHASMPPISHDLDVQTPAERRTGRSGRAQFRPSVVSSSVMAHTANEGERHGNDRHQ